VKTPEKLQYLLPVAAFQGMDILSSYMVLSIGSQVTKYEFNLLFKALQIPIETTFFLSAFLGVGLAYYFIETLPLLAEIQIFIIPFVVLGNSLFYFYWLGIIPQFAVTAINLVTLGAVTFYCIAASWQIWTSEAEGLKELFDGTASEVFVFET
jgi:hypothetical protein